jgi:hypothetical protein
MALFGLFRSRAERDAELKARVRQGTLKINRFVQQLTRQADEYAALARRAWELDDEEQFRVLAGGYLKCLETVNRWERYVVRLKALELRRGESEATREFLSSMNALTASILNGVRPEQVAMLGTEMEAAIVRSEELSESLATTIDGAADVVSSGDLRDTAALLKLVPPGNPGAVKSPGQRTRTDAEFWAAVEGQRAGTKTSTGPHF